MQPIYRLLESLGMLTTKTVWPVRCEEGSETFSALLYITGSGGGLLPPTKPIDSFAKDRSRVIAPKDLGTISLAEPANERSHSGQPRVSRSGRETGESRGVQHRSEKMIDIAPFPP